VATVLTLGLGIGANSAIFSVVNAVLIKPLPYKDADQLTLVYATAPGAGDVRSAMTGRNFVSIPDFEDWNASAQSFSGFTSLVAQSVNLTGSDTPDRVVGSFVAHNHFEVLGVQPALGRLFAKSEDRPGMPLVTVLTDRIWHNRFGGDPNIIGRKLLLNGEPYTVIGILPSTYIEQPWDSDVYLPAFKYPNYTLDRARASAAVIARMKPGVSVAQAQSEMSAIAARLAAAYPNSNRDRGALVIPLKEIVVSNIKPSVLALAAAVGFVLLIACANVAGLFTARMVGRERERAVRLALGAGRAQLMSHVLAEALVLAIAGASAGLGLAAWGMGAVSKAIADQLPAGTRVGLDATTLLFTAGIAILTALLIAAIPAWQSSSATVLREGGRAGSSAARNRLRGVLAAGEIAMAMVLLTGAGLAMKSLLELGRARPGFDTRNLMTFEYRVPPAKYPTDAQRIEFHRRAIEEIRRVPGVILATSVLAVPLGGNGQAIDFLVNGRPEGDPAHRPNALFNAADPYFFETMRIPVLRGRAFNEHDTASSAKVVVVNQTLASRFFVGDPIGRSIRVPDLNLTAEIVGVVGDVKQFSLEDPPSPQAYQPLTQFPFVFTSVAVRTMENPQLLMNEIRRAVWRVDQDQPMWKMRTVNEKIAMLARPREFVSSLLGGYAGLALLLASIGIFGVISYSVSQRTAEIGLRMALGAAPGDVARMILRQGAGMLLMGIAAGSGLSAWLARLLQAQLFAVSPLDPAVYAMMAGVLTAVALAACMIPARRAMRVDPVVALRHE
jgi:putative ABC transport system permease protein